MKRLVLFIALATSGAMLPAGNAGAGNCGRCGCHPPTTKICRPVCEMKEVREVCYDVICEEFCIPGRTPCKKLFGSCGADCQHCATPTCGKVRTRNKLVKREVTRQVPTTRWVIEEVCHTCCTPADRPLQGAEPADVQATSALKAFMSRPPRPAESPTAVTH